MKTDTKQRILAYIKEKKEVSAKDIIAYCQFSPQAVFKHLKKLQAAKEIYKIGKPPLVRYYVYGNNIGARTLQIKDAFSWAVAGEDTPLSPGQHCGTRDIFQGRCDRLAGIVKKLLHNENSGYLVAAVTGEIGNNSFDHNIGQWLGEPGIIFIVDENNRVIIIADRGQGVLATLKRVRPQLVNHQKALHTAFTEKISGRAPEQRGNGLKFVKKVIEENSWQLTYYSGNAMVKINSNSFNVSESNLNIPGMLAIINF